MCALRTLILCFDREKADFSHLNTPLDKGERSTWVCRTNFQIYESPSVNSYDPFAVSLPTQNPASEDWNLDHVHSSRVKLPSFFSGYTAGNSDLYRSTNTLKHYQTKGPLLHNLKLGSSKTTLTTIKA